MAYGSRNAADGHEGRLVAIHTFTEPWSMWEMHPKGSEVVVCLKGHLTLIQERGTEHVRIEIPEGAAAVNPPGIWHTADVSGPTTALFITAGEGTAGRPR